MPNMVGGDQMHPAYMARKLEKHEEMVGNVLYWVDGTRVLAESAEGAHWVADTLEIPKKLKRYLRKQIQGATAEHVKRAGKGIRREKRT